MCVHCSTFVVISHTHPLLLILFVCVLIMSPHLAQHVRSGVPV